MSQPVVFQCSQCQQQLQVVPLDQPSQVKCVVCGELLAIPARQAQSPQTPRATQAPSPLQPPNPPQSQSPKRGYSPPFQGSNPQSFGNTSPLPKPKRKLSSLQLFGIILASVLLLFFISCGLGIYRLGQAVATRQNVDPIGTTLQETTLSQDAFPELRQPERTYPSGIKRYFVRMNSQRDLPGQRMSMRVFVPAGRHPDKSLPCVLVAPAGTPLIHGAALELGSDYDAETLPYAEAGFVVIQYSIDGPMPPNADSLGEMARLTAMASAYEKFKDAAGGVVNGRNAIDFAINKLSYVDPNRIHCAGHSSAGTLSLLLGAHESRINRCVAYAAAYDLENRMRELTSDEDIRFMFPGIRKFIPETSPLNHIENFHSPVFVFHARDDSNVPFSDATKFVSQLKDAGKDITFETSATGEHYQSMISDGIPRAIEWLKQANR